MVIGYDSDLKKTDKNGDQPQGHRGAGLGYVAAPSDRLAANVIDYVILLGPLILFLVSPLQRVLREARIEGNEFLFVFSGALILILSLLTLILFQTLCLWLYGTTPGKWLMGLKVVHIWSGKKPRFLSSLYRSGSFLLGLVSLGLPYLSIFTNPKRRALHDRLSDTMVVTSKENRSVGRPNFLEEGLVKGFFTSVLVGLLLLAGAIFFGEISNQRNQMNITSLILEDAGLLCAEIGSAKRNWPLENGEAAERLSVAMALFAAGEVGRDCLEMETVNHSFSDENSPLIYLARSFVYSDQQELSDMYLDQTCILEPSSNECEMSKAIELIAEQKWSDVEAQFNQISEDAEIYIWVWAVRQLMSQSNYAMAQTYMNRIPMDSPTLASFVAPLRSKILWSLNKKDEARGAASIAYSFLSQPQRLMLSSWFCLEEVELGCDEVQESASCQVLENSISQHPALMRDVELAFTDFRLKECSLGQDKAINYVLISDAHPQVQTAANALNSRKSNELKGIVSSSQYLRQIRDWAAIKILERSPNRKNFHFVYEYWKESPPSLSWERLGIEMSHWLFEQDDLETLIEVGESLIPFLGSSHKDLLEKLIIASFESNSRLIVDELLRAYESFSQKSWKAPTSEAKAYRAPASEDRLYRAIKGIQ